MSSTSNVVVRPLKRDDLDQIVQWFSENDDDNSFNYVLEDFEIEMGSKGVFMLVAENAETGQLLGHIAVTKHNSVHSFVSLFFVPSQFKSIGVDDLLWKKGKEVAKTPNIIVDSTTENFKFSLNGFVDHYQLKPTHWQIHRFAGIPKNWETLWKTVKHSELHVCHAQMVRAEDLADFERQITNLHRVEWWRRFINHSNEWIPESVSLIVTKDSSILGFGMVRPGRRRPQLGPLYALREDVARLLIRNLMGSSRKAREQGIEMAVPSCNAATTEIVQRLNLSLRDTRQRYFTKIRPNLNFGNIYSLSNSLVQYV